MKARFGFSERLLLGVMKFFGAGKNKPPHRAEHTGRETAAVRPVPLVKYNRPIAGNVFFAIFAAVAMVGAVGVGFNTVLRGPISGMTDVTRRTVAESTIVTSSRLAIVGATTQQTTADCDDDGMVEPMPFRVPTAGLPAPVGGGYLPTGLVPDSIDPWKTEYGYCAWDAGTTTVTDNAAGCGGSTATRLVGSPDGKQYSIAIISAGKNKKFETDCNAYADTAPADGKPDTLLIDKPTGSDDIVLGYTYAEANDLGAGMWTPTERDVDNDGDMDDVATTRNALEGTGDASFGGAINLQGNVLTGGGLVLPADPGDDSLTGPCNSANDKQIRRNTATVPPTLELCNFAGGLGWSPLSGAATGGGGGGGGGMTGTLVSRWMLDETSGTVVADSVGGNNGTIVNGGPGWTDDAATGGAIDFQLNGNQNIVIPRSTSLEPTAISISLWVKMTSGMNGTLINKGYGNCSQGYGCYPSYGLLFENGRPNFWTNTATGCATIRFQQNTPLTAGQWQHLVASYDPAAAAPQVKLYLNGVLDATSNCTEPLLYDTSAGEHDLYIGSSGPQGWWAGLQAKMDDVRIYNYAISDVEVHNLYNSAKPAIRSNTTQAKAGQLATWGFHSQNRLGDGSTTSRPSPNAVTNGRDFTQISMGPLNACGVKAGGTVWCWGYGLEGQIGNGADLTAYYPTKVSNLTDVVKVTSGTGFNCALRRNGEAWCWGNGSLYRLGNGSTSNSNIPVKVSSITDFVDISVGIQTACGVRQNGEAWCWGGGTKGQLGNGAILDSAVPVKVSNVTDFASVSVATATNTFAVCGATRSGLAYCWGEERTGNFGDGAATGVQSVPVQVSPGPTGIKDFVEVGLGYDMGCGLRGNGQVWCWGADAYGQLGNGATAGTQALPTLVTTHSDFKKIAFNQYSVCGIRTNNELWCWGNDTSWGELGNGAAITADQPSPVKSWTNVIDISGSAAAYAAILDTNVRPIPTPIPQKLAVSPNVIDQSICSITGSGQAWCWGLDADGQLGNGGITGTKYSPSLVTDRGPWGQVSGGGRNNCGIKFNGTLWCWGANGASGWLGLGTATASYTSPTELTSTVTWSTVSQSTVGGCAIKMDGTLWCWGQGLYGRIGNGSTSNQLSPVQVGADKKWLSVSASNHVTCAIAGDNSAWCWGYDTSEALGNGPGTANQSTPVRVSDPGPWASISANNNSTCGVKMDGTGWCWGTATGGILGNNATSSAYATPQLIAEPGPWQQLISSGQDTTCGLKVDGTAWCWGSATGGQLGNGLTSGTYAYPVPVTADKDWVEIRVGNDRSCGRKKDDTVWCWGSDTDGVLGNGSAITATQSRPYRVSTIPLRDPWMPAEHGGGFDLLPGLDASIGTGRWISSNGGSATGLSFGGSGRTSFRAATLYNDLILESISEVGMPTYDPDTGQMIGGSTNTPSSQVTFASASATDTGTLAFTPRAVSFDSGDYLSGTLTGDAASDNDKITMSFWFRISPTATEDYNVIYEGENTAGRVQIGVHGAFDGPSNDGLWQLRVQLRNSADLELALGDGGGIRTENNLEAGVWYNALISADTTNSWIHLYINDVENIHSGNKSMNIGTIDFGANHTISTAGGAMRYEGDLAEMQIDIGTYTDFSLASNRRLYINEKGGPVKPLSPGVPEIYLAGYDSVWSSWQQNIGAAGGFTLASGALTDAATSPMNGTYVSTGLRIDRSVGTDMVTGNFKIARSANLYGREYTQWLGNLDADLEVTAAGNVGIGTYGSPQAKLDVNGAIKIGDDSTCTAAKNGMINWNGTKMQFCNAGTWKDFGLYGGPTYWEPDLWLGNNHTCNIQKSGMLSCWGNNTDGRLGINNLLVQYNPVTVVTNTGSGEWTDWIKVAANQSHSCGIRANGTAWCWGAGFNGKLGNNNGGASSSIPVQVRDNAGTGYWTDWIKIAVGESHTCGIRVNGTLWCWGAGANGRLGRGSTSNALLPVQVQDNVGPTAWSDWTDITLGEDHTCGIRANGTAWCWGTGGFGKLADGGTSDRTRPVRVQDDVGPTAWSDWTRITAGKDFNCGLRLGGTAWCWGMGTDGIIGNGTTSDSSRPKQVTTTTGPGFWSDWTKISAGFATVCGVRANGTAWCWGAGNGGQIGNGTTSTPRTRPLQVHTDTGPGSWTDWTGIATGIAHTCGSRIDGSMWCWGTNTLGQLGNGGTAQATRPVRVAE